MSADDLLYAPVSGSAPASVVTAALQQSQPQIRLPSSWVTVIDAIRNYNPHWANTALAGGCLRDVDLGRPVKDIDIFLPYGIVGDTGEHLSQCLNQVYPSNITVFEVPHKANSNSALSNGTIVPSHYTFEIDGWLFEITQKIEPFDHRSILDSFDLGICMICLDGNTIYRTPEYQADVTQQKITVVRSTGGREVQHAKRLRHKYTGWSVVGP